MLISWKTTAFSAELMSLTEPALPPINETTTFAVPREYNRISPFRVSFEKNDILLAIKAHLSRRISCRNTAGRPIHVIQLLERLDDTSMRHLHVDLSSDRSRLVFSFWHSVLSVSNGLHVLPRTINIHDEDLIDQLHSVIESAAHFFWYLDCHPGDILCGAPKLDITPTFCPLHRRTQRSFWRPLDNILGPSNCVTLAPVEPEVRYGLGLENNTNLPLYASVFYFDCSDFSICTSGIYTFRLDTDVCESAPLYLSNSSRPLPGGTQRQADFSLQANGGTLTLGWGSGGVLPMCFDVPEESKYDVGFIKIFVSTSWVDLSSVAQSTPFGRGHRATVIVKDADRLLASAIWDTILITVVQKKHA